ncbi:ATP-binding cassette sub-family C member 5 isoform X2 [Anabrus simplex]|uniref:ATP-binding cassette sub-family C member 5 isoform X2 n=1 Tax=Anabrus simplex TaxID=316456 RepID=UPI0035A2E002
MTRGDDSNTTFKDENSVHQSSDSEAIVDDPLQDSLINNRPIESMDRGTLKLSPYRAYVETSPQYIPGRGIARYHASLKNLIPIRNTPKQKNAIAVDRVGLLSFIFHTWLSPFMYKAYKKGLTAEDIPQGSPLESCDLNAQRLELLWQEEVARKGMKDASFGSAVWKFVRTRMIISSMIFSLSLVMGFISPTIFMRKLIQFTEKGNANIWEGITWALCLTFIEFLRIILFTWFWGLNYRTAVRLRSACLALIYKKVIRLQSYGGKSIGQLINIFANDGQRIFDMAMFASMIVGGPLVTVFGVVYIYLLLGPWALFGMASFLLFYPSQYGISRLTSYLRAKTVVISDLRVKLMTEILICIKFIKMCAWERSLVKSIQDIRTQESNLLQKAAYCQSLSVSMASTVPVISAIITFLSHVGAGYNLTAAEAFPFIGILNGQMRSTFGSLQIATNLLYEALVSLKRVKSILMLEETPQYVTRPIDKTDAVHIVRGKFAWVEYPANDVKQKKTGRKQIKSYGKQNKRERMDPLIGCENKLMEVLDDINFNVPKGKLIGVCGHVGSGKTSLLLACLGQLKMMSGQVTRDGSCAYVSQEAWILNATLRENILFGESFNSKRYYEVVYCCSLTEDINMLPGGDQTEIGERGINLSGGQKQRVALARALYANRDIYFLDDPLSAVDANVGNHIFEKCILSALRDKTVVLVTHQVQYLSKCYAVYMLKDGRIIEHGSHEELMAKNDEYAIMIKTCQVDKNQNDDTSDEHENGPVQLSPVDFSEGSSVNLHTKREDKMEHTGAEQLVAPETIVKGNITHQTYQNYISAAGGFFIAMIVILTFLLNVGSTTFSSWWLASWLKAGGGETNITINNETVRSQHIGDNPDFPFYRNVYAITIAIIVGTCLLRGFIFSKATLRASTNLHKKLLSKIMQSPMCFFETTPTGRIQNLFSRDMDEVDVRLPIAVENIIQNIWIVFFAIISICLVFPWFVIPLVFLAVLYYTISSIFRVAIRDLKRLENASRSPIFSWVGTSIQGLSTIHAFGKENEFMSRFSHLFDENSTCLYLCHVSSRWLGIRIDCLAACVVCITSFMVILLQGQVPPAMAGLALSYSAHISGVFQYTVRLISETEARFISVERITSYIESLVSEGGTNPQAKPPSDWPTKGSIKFKNVSLCYRQGLPNVLKDINFSILPGEKIGIVGRTGSGKSSLITALFRLVELSGGQIKVDNLDIANIPLELLRSSFSVIPQDPVLFAGTIRSNLDPFGLYSDAQVWDALEKVNLRGRIAGTNAQLGTPVGQSGDNFSTGERQLLCLARAILKNAKILVLDEATASVDPETEIAVQNTVQSEFQQCTVLIIAHRLTTVTSCHRIIVMDRGQVLECDTPANLLANHDSHFYQMFSITEAVVKAAVSA